MMQAQRGLLIVVASVVFCALAATPAFAYLYVLKHPKREHCRVHYASSLR